MAKALTKFAYFVMPVAAPMKRKSFALLCAAVLAGLSGTFTAAAQQPTGGQPTSALASEESFLAALRGVDWECSFTAYPRMRFSADKIELLSQNGQVTRTLNKVSVLEPGILRMEYGSGGMALFIFAEDMKSFVIASMSNASEFDIPGATGPVQLPTTDAAAPVEVVFKDNPYWAKARLHATKMEILDGSDKVFATNGGFAFYPNTLGLKLPEKEAGLALLSRKRAGGWYFGGRHFGTGVPTKLIGVFRTTLRSQMTDFALRTAHFARSLLRAGHEQTAYAQEQYAEYNAINVYGENSMQVVLGMNEMGKLRGFSLSYDRAAEWSGRAYEAMKANFPNNAEKLLEVGTDYGDSLADRGDFEKARAILMEVQPHVEAQTNLRTAYGYYKALGSAEFGLRNYTQAVEIFAQNERRAIEGKMEGNEVDAMLDQAACYVALGKPMEAAARVSVAATRQAEVIKQFPKITFDTYKLSLACSMMQKWPEANQFSEVRQRRGSVTYMECARLLSLICKGEKPAAQKLAQDFTKRYGGDMEDIQIRRDIDAMIVSVTKAAAEQTPQAVAELEQTWAQQVASLRNRPLQNYIFARVMMAAIAELKK